MTSPRFLDESDCWRVAGIRSAEAFFRAVPLLVPDATHLCLEGAPAPDIAALIADDLEEGDDRAPTGTLWSWPRPERRFTVRASEALFARPAEAAAHHAEPEVCSHLHLYRDHEPLVQWFDAFTEPLLVSKAVPRERVERFCADTGGELSDAAA
jgi:hypothetical protein